jgi:zinc D-Ala-D-Ala carboxypeptidase
MKFKNFSYDEFDSPLQEGSGQLMSNELISMLDDARELAGVPFKITSGYRIEADIERLKKAGYKVSRNSSHLKGLAADIACIGTGDRYNMLDALMKVGFNRIGIADTFIHVDIDPYKPLYSIWTY